jgi:hypothetical protein
MTAGVRGLPAAWWRRLDSGDRAALGQWAAAHLALFVLAWAAAWVLYLLTMPAAIFLMVGYAECLFLALAIPAWHAATQGRWWRAAVLAGLAGLVRVDAVFLIISLAVMALTGPRTQALGTPGPARTRPAGSSIRSPRSRH